MPGGKFLARDARGAELSVETDTGVPTLVAVPGSGSNFKVTFAVEGLKYPVYGFVSATGNDQLMDTLRTAAEHGQAVHFRIESRRKATVPATTAWVDLDHKTQCRRLLAQAGGVWSAEVADDLADDARPATTAAAPSAPVVPAGVTPLTGGIPASSVPAPVVAAPPAPAPAVDVLVLPAGGASLERLQAAVAARPDLAGFLVAAAVTTTDLPLDALLALAPVTATPQPAPQVETAPAPEVKVETGTDAAPEAPEPVMLHRAGEKVPASRPLPTAPAARRRAERPQGPAVEAPLPPPAPMVVDPGYDDIEDADELEERYQADPPRPARPVLSMADQLGKLVKLMRMADLAPVEVASWVRRTYQVPGVQYLEEPDLIELLDTYRVLGPVHGPAQFAQDVRA